MGAPESSSAGGGREYKRLSEEGDRAGRSHQSRCYNTKRARVTPDHRNKNDPAESGSGFRDSEAEPSGGAASSQHKPSLDFDLAECRANQLFRFIRHVASGTISADYAARSLRKRSSGCASNSTLVFRILDCVSFFLDFPSYKQHLSAFLSALERCGLVTSHEIVAAIDAHKLDDCGYSTGLVTTAIRERTRKQFVSMCYGLWRECTVGFHLLHQVLYRLNWNPSKADDMSRLHNLVRCIAGKNSLCPNRLLYELISWCSWNDGDSVALVLSMYPTARIKEMINQMLSHQHSTKREYQTSRRQHWRTPDSIGASFFRLCARLLVDGSIELGDLYKYLEPPDAMLKGLASHFLTASKKKNIKLERTTPPVTYLIPIANSSSGDGSVRQVIRALRKGQLGRSGWFDSSTISHARDIINSRHVKLVDQVLTTGKMHGSAYTPEDSMSSTSTDSDLKSSKSSRDSSGDRSSRHDSNTKSSKSNSTTSRPEFVDLVKYSFLPDDTYAYMRDHIYALECEKLTLLANLIDISPDMDSYAWKVSKHFLMHLQFTAMFPVILHGKISMALCRLASRVITNHMSASRLDDCLAVIEDVLGLVGPVFYVDLVCLAKTIKVLDLSLETHENRVCKIMWLYMFPCLALVVEGNCQVNARLWNILSRLPASKRYWIYQMYISVVLNGNSKSDKPWMNLVRAAHNGVLMKARSLFKRVTSTLLRSSKSASVRSNVSTVSGLASVNPFAVAHTIISQCEMFENLVLPLSEVAKYFGDLACDAFFFKLCATQNQVCFNSTSECDELGLSKRLSINAQLTARFFRRHSNSDICPLLLGVLLVIMRSMMKTSFLVAPHSAEEEKSPRRRDGNKSIDLKPLKVAPKGSYPDDISPGWLVVEYVCKLMELAGGVPQLAETHALTVDQLNAQAGGILLRSEIMAQDPDDETCSTTAREALAHILLRPLFCHGLLLLAGKIRLEVLYDSDFRGNVMLLCAIVDRLQKVALQLGEFKESINAILGRHEEFEELMTANFNLPPIEEIRKFWIESTSMYLDNISRKSPSPPHLEYISNGPFKKEFLEFIMGAHLSDIWVPTEQYQKSLQRLSDWIKEGGSGHSGGSHRRAKKLRSRYQSLEREMKQQIEHVAATKEKFATVLANGWLLPNAQPGPGVTIAFLDQCIVSRVFVNEAEALYCGRIVDIMLSQRVEYFNFFDFYNCWTKMLMSTVRCCTEREAPLLAIFVNHEFSVIKHWSTNPEEFELVTKDHPCYCTTFKYMPDKALTHQQLLGGIRKWEGRILRALSYSLGLHISDPEGGSNKAESRVAVPTWVDQKSAVVFLARCHENFPITSVSGKRLLAGLREVTDNAQQRGWKDVYVAASTLVKTFEMYDRDKKWL